MGFEIIRWTGGGGGGMNCFVYFGFHFPLPKKKKKKHSSNQIKRSNRQRGIGNWNAHERLRMSLFTLVKPQQHLQMIKMRANTSRLWGARSVPAELWSCSCLGRGSSGGDRISKSPLSVTTEALVPTVPHITVPQSIQTKRTRTLLKTFFPSY